MNGSAFKLESLMVGKGGLPPRVECPSVRAGQATLADLEISSLESFFLTL
jgi:hypothetical protein